GEVRMLGRAEYVEVVCDFLERLPPEMVIQRLNGDAPPDYLVAPDWCLDKPGLLREIEAELERRDSWQGKHCRRKVGTDSLLARQAGVRIPLATVGHRLV